MDFPVPIRTTQPISDLSVVVTGCTLLSVDVRSLLMTSSDSKVRVEGSATLYAGNALSAPHHNLTARRFYRTTR